MFITFRANPTKHMQNSMGLSCQNGESICYDELSELERPPGPFKRNWARLTLKNMHPKRVSPYLGLSKLLEGALKRKTGLPYSDSPVSHPWPNSPNTCS